MSSSSGQEESEGRPERVAGEAGMDSSDEEETTPARSPSGVPRARRPVLHSSSEEEEEGPQENGAREGGSRQKPEDPEAGASSSSAEEVAGDTSGRANSSRIRRASSSSSASSTSSLASRRSPGGRPMKKTPGSPPTSRRPPVDSDTSDEGVDDPNPPPRRRSGSDSDDSVVDEAVHDKKGRRRGKEKLSRKSKKSAMAEIYSEKNRMLREAAVQLPYHRPKQRTLEEFLNRKKGLRDVVSDIRLNVNSLEVEEAEKILLEREKAANEFYKSEEEEEDEDADDEDYVPEGMETAMETSQDSQRNEHTADGKAQEAVAEGEMPDCNNSGPVAGNKDVGEAPEEKEAKGDHTLGLEKAAITDEERKKFQESESLHLVLENDTEPLLESQDNFKGEKETNTEESPKETEQQPEPNPIKAKIAALAGENVDLTELDRTLEAAPKLGAGLSGGGDLILGGEEEDPSGEKKDELMSRFVRHLKAGKGGPAVVSKDVNLTIVRKVNEDGTEKLKAEEIRYESRQVDFAKVRAVKGAEVPGAQHLALKQTLRRKIDERKRLERKRREEMKKMENEEGFGPDDEELLEDEDMEDEEEEEEDESYDGEDEEEEEDEETVEKRLRALDRKQKRKSQFLDEEAEESDQDQMGRLTLEESDDEQKDKDEDDEDLPDTMELVNDNDDGEEKKRGDDAEADATSASVSRDGLATPTNDLLLSSQIEEEAPRWTPFDERTNSNLEEERRNGEQARKRLGFGGLFDTSDPQVEGTDDVVGLCSGQFLTQRAPPRTQVQTQKQTAAAVLTTQATPDTVVLAQTLTQNLEGETQDTIVLSRRQEEEEPAPGFLEETPGFLDSSGGEEGAGGDQQIKKKKKKAARIVMSDDSDGEDEKEDGEVAEDDEGEEEAEERQIEYDSDENEIVVEKPKFGGFLGKKGIRGEFVENEAELSGSEGEVSGDEDERGLDRLEAEEGDLEDFDDEEVRDEVGKIHHRRALDEDRADVRLFQEAFLEDGELHSDQARARRFRWKNIDDTEELQRRDSDDEAESALVATNEGEEKRRLERLEREKWLKESSAKATANDFAEEEDDEDSQFFNMASKAVRCLEKKRSTSSRGSKKAEKTEGDVFKSPTPKMPLRSVSGNQRGSFLSRASETLDRLAEMTKGKHETRVGTGANSGSAKFVFATVSPSKGGDGDEEEASAVAAGSDSKAQGKRRQKGSTSVPAVTQKRKRAVGNDEATKAKVVRTLDENSMDTIFGRM